MKKKKFQCASCRAFISKPATEGFIYPEEILLAEFAIRIYLCKRCKNMASKNTESLLFVKDNIFDYFFGAGKYN